MLVKIFQHTPLEVHFVMFVRADSTCRRPLRGRALREVSIQAMFVREDVGRTVGDRAVGGRFGEETEGIKVF